MSSAAQNGTGGAAGAAAALPAPLPVLFMGHGGGPCFFLKGGMFSDMDRDSAGAAFFKKLGKTLALPAKPAALLVISAHWEGEGGAVHVQTGTGAPRPLLYDYYGFPKEAYEIEWPAPIPPASGVPGRALELLRGAGFSVREDASRGFDHGVFVPLKLAFPGADIPTFQVSLQSSLDPAAHLRLGRALAPLRREGVLILASGFMTHNLGELHPPGTPPQAWAQGFDSWVAGVLAGEAASAARGPAVRAPKAPAITGASVPYAAAAKALAGIRSAPHFARAHPRAEHLMPLLVAVGAADPTALIDGSGSGRATAAVAADGAQVTAPSAEPQLRSSELFSQMVNGAASMSTWRFD